MPSMVYVDIVIDLKGVVEEALWIGTVGADFGQCRGTVSCVHNHRSEAAALDKHQVGWWLRDLLLGSAAVEAKAELVKDGAEEQVVFSQCKQLPLVAIEIGILREQNIHQKL